MVVPVRGYYIARTEDTLRSVAAQFLNAPERWSELRALNAAYPGIADLDPDELVPEGAALALPGDPLPWGRPDPVYLWTLAETFLYTAWGREPAPEEVVPFWRGLTQGAQLEGEQQPPGAELPGVAEIAASSDQPGDETPSAPAAPPAPRPAFEMPAAVDADTAEPLTAAEPLAAETPADEPADGDRREAVGLDMDRADVDALAETPADTAEIAPEHVPDEIAPEHVPDEIAPEHVEHDPDEIAPEHDADEIAPEHDPEAAADDAAEGEPAVAADDEPESEPAPEAADAPVDAAAEAPADISEAPVDDLGAAPADDLGAAPADDLGAAPADEAEAPQPDLDAAALAGLADAVEEATEDGTRAIAEDGLDVEDSVETGRVDEPAAEMLDAEPEPPPAFEEWLADPPPPLVDPAAPPPLADPPPPLVDPAAPPPLHDPLPPPPLPDPSLPYAGMPGAGTADAPPLPPETEAPRVPHFMPSVTGTTPEGLTTAAQSSPVGRSLAGTAVGDAMLLWQLARRRRQGQRVAGATDAIEQSLLHSAAGESLELIEAAMRHLRAVTVDQQRPKPSVLAVRSGTYGFEVLLDRPIPTPPGWRSASGGYVLELPQGVTARDLGAVGQGPSLCPALVPVGNTFEGPLLLNLEQLGCLAISGPSAPATGLLGAIVGALGSSPMAGHARITAVGLDSSASTIGWEAVSFASYDSPELESLLANAYRPDDGVIDLLAIGPGNDLLIQRASQVASAPESRLSLVGTTSAVSARWPWRIHVDGTGTAVVHPIAVTMSAARAVQSEMLAPHDTAPPGGIDPAGLR